MRFTTLNDWLHWQEQLHPKNIELGLERVSRVWRRLRPQGLSCPVISVAGTNGKGSTVALLETILQAAGYRTGCYTSPHLLRYNERIHLDGEEIDDQSLCEAFERIDQARGDISLTYFEFGTLAALELFAQNQVECAILEVGLGGRLDAVNLLDADLAIITGVAMDHMDWLGDDLDGIAREKAGICRKGHPVVVTQQQPPQGLLQSIETIGARLYLHGRDFSRQRQDNGWSWQGVDSQRPALPLPRMRAARQLDNAAAVLMALELLQNQLPVGQDAVRTGLLNAALQGRFQVIPGDTPIILDVAHNPQAASYLARDLGDMPCLGNSHAVFGCFKDKDARGIIKALHERVDTWHLVEADNARAMSIKALCEIIKQEQPLAEIIPHDNVAQALEQLQGQTGPNDRILVAGSFLTVSAALGHINRV